VKSEGGFRVQDLKPSNW